jgi:putative ABC transport system permease protein
MKSFILAFRTLRRNVRRTLLTASLIAIGVAFVLIFSAFSGSFKSYMVGQITDSMLGHLQIHKKGYVASLDNLPLDKNLAPKAIEKITGALDADPGVESYSLRLKLGAMISNFDTSTNIRLNGVNPVQEFATVPLLANRITGSSALNPGELLIPEVLAKGMALAVGDTVVLVATNRSGSMNALTMTIAGVVGIISGPGGRDGYIHIDDARELLRMQEAEVSEIAIRLKDFSALDRVTGELKQALEGVLNPEGKPVLEIHTWADLSPFASLARMIDVMTLFIKIVLVSIVLVSVMNVMIMAVYERIREIGTIAAIGTPPSRILSLFLGEGLLLGLIGTAAGTLISLAAIYALNVWKITFAFGQQQNLVLAPTIAAADVATIAALVVGVAVLASLQPAWKASRLDPILALRHV